MFLAWVCHCITAYFSGFSFWTSLLIENVELHLLSNRIQKFLNFTLPFIVLIHPFRIGKSWLFIFLARLGVWIISCSKLHSDIFVTLLSCICINLAWFSITYECLYSSARLSYSIFSFISSRLLFLPDSGRSHHSHFPKIFCLMIEGNSIFGFNHVELSTMLSIIVWFSFFSETIVLVLDCSHGSL